MYKNNLLTKDESSIRRNDTRNTTRTILFFSLIKNTNIYIYTLITIITSILYGFLSSIYLFIYFKQKAMKLIINLQHNQQYRLIWLVDQQKVEEHLHPILIQVKRNIKIKKINKHIYIYVCIYLFILLLIYL